jgi:hypothetical protein
MFIDSKANVLEKASWWCRGRDMDGLMEEEYNVVVVIEWSGEWSEEWKG